jgi:hypothetical protein
MSANSRSIVKKWLPVIELKMGYKNVTIMEYICVYCEWSCQIEQTQMYYTQGKYELPEKLIEIRDKIDSFERVEVLGKYFNPVSGMVEHKLSNGKFIPENGETSYDLSDSDINYIFGDDFIVGAANLLRDLDPVRYRDKQIDRIL